MKKKVIKSFLIGTGALLGILIAVLAIHIYVVTRPKPPDEHTRIMARIDIKQDLSAADSAKITNWLYQQQGVDHVLCNPHNRVAVFTYFPIKTNANRIVADFNGQLPYQGVRYLPTAAEMSTGCPAMAPGFGNKVAALFKHMF